MRKIISGIGVLVGFLLIMLGFIVCMCETADLYEQMKSLVFGVLMMVIGTITCYFGKEGSEYYDR